MRSELILMLKFPLPGGVKTRLIPALGEQGACDLYRAMVRRALRQAREFATNSAMSATVTARVAGAADAEAVRRWLGDGIEIQPQGAGDLGDRMKRAAHDALAAGATSVVLIGADCPELEPRHLETAFTALAHTDLVLGPAADGGYYLIGMRRFLPELFEAIEWGGSEVLRQTLVVAHDQSIEYDLLETLQDLDRPEDLPHWARTEDARISGHGGVSIILPTHNEAANLPMTLETAQRGQPHEIILVDGGSTDRTVEIGRAADVIVLRAPLCRARQMNLGAAVATGESLLFLHADTLLPDGYSAQIRSLLSQSGTLAGAFGFAVKDDFPGRRWVERGTNWRARRWQFPYGDQALFLHRATFQEMGGFPELPIMEDYAFVRRLRRRGRIEIAPAVALTSGRRWLRHGVVRTTLINRAMILGYHAGISPARLARWYRGSGPQRSGHQDPPVADSERVPARSV